MKSRPPSVLILADPREMADSHPVWGTGGWLPAVERTALDWLTLCRLMGLDADVVAVDGFRAGRLDATVRWLILACDVLLITDDQVSKLKAAMESQTMLLICQTTGMHHPLGDWHGIRAADSQSSGSRLHGAGEAAGFSRMLAKPLTTGHLHPTGATSPAAFLDDAPVAATAAAGRGRVLVLSFLSSVLRDHDGAGSALLRHLMSACATAAHASLDWQGVLIPRMDDPGSSEALHHEIYNHTCLGRDEWNALATVLRDHDAKTSIGYVSGWVDAGQAAPGTLWIDGMETPRASGMVHPSPLVRFDSSHSGSARCFDHAAEYQSLLELRRQGLAEVELHGHTHICPDRGRWLAAPDRFSNRDWFREFGAAAAAWLAQHPELPHAIDQGLAIMREFFDRSPTTLICPGEVFTRQTLIKALDAGLMQVSSYYLAFRHRDRLCWAQHVCAPYLDKADASWFDAGLPVVGCYHDFDIARHGVDWLAECLDGWRAAGCRWIMGLDDLNALLQLRMSLNESAHGWELHLHGNPSWPLPPRLEILLHFPGREVPGHVNLFLDGEPAGSHAIEPLYRYSAILRIRR